MDSTSSASLPDWIVLTTRWVFLIALSFWHTFETGADWPVLAVLILIGLGNILATVILLLDQTSPAIRLTYTILDFLFAHVLFYLSIGTNQELTWLGFMPLITASFYYQWIGAFSGILINTLIQGFIADQFATLNEALLLVGVFLPLYILVGLGLAYLSVKTQFPFQSPKERRLVKLSPAEIKKQDRRQTLYDLISELSATLNYQKVLETSLDLGRIALSELGAKVDKLTSAVMLFSTKRTKSPELTIATARRLLSNDKGVILPGIRGALARVIEEGVTIFVKDPKTDPELRRLIALHECRSAYLMPLRTGLESYGVLLFAHPDPDFFTAERQEVLEIVRNQSTIAIQNARLYQALELEKNRMMEIQEESRKKLARELHDGPTQSISAIAMRVNFARRLMDRDLKSASEELFKIEELARKTIKEIRHMLSTLRPLVLESKGLVVALESMAEQVHEIYDQEVSVQLDPQVVDKLDVAKQGVIFYIVEEAVNNARKHARSSHIWVRLKPMGEGIGLLEIEDDGIGFDTSMLDSSYESRGSLGMINLRERSELINGILRIESTPGSGTCVKVLIPLTDEAVEHIRGGG